MLASALDALLQQPRGAPELKRLHTRWGDIALTDTGGSGPVLLMTPDGPNVIAHHAALITLLAPHARVICFDMPGFGYSGALARYGHRLEQGADAALALMDALALSEAALHFSCVNGLYAIAAAKRAPRRIRRLVLCQTPSLRSMRAWAQVNVPWPVQTPVLGQLLVRATRRRIAHGWYGAAVPDKVQRAQFRVIADHALTRGACYCLAGVVQGVSSARPELLQGVQTPTHLFWGDVDRSHRNTRAESLTELLPQAQITHFSDCGHFPELEQPQRYAQQVLSALG